MYKERSVGSEARTGASKSDLTLRDPLDRKRINDALDKHLERSSPSTSKAGVNGSKDRIAIPSTSSGKMNTDHKDGRSGSLSKNKCSDGVPFILFIRFYLYRGL